MAAMIHLDTHVVLWLYDKAIESFSPTARAAVDANDLGVSPMVALELEYLREIGRTKVSGTAVIEDLATRIGLRVSDATFAEVVSLARELSWTRDPFDRLIAANATADGCRLLTADRALLHNFPHAFWES